MTIPNFKSIDDYQEFINLFDDRWQVKFECLNHVKNDMYPGHKWIALPPASLETINDITQSLRYDVEYTFKEKHPDYKTEDDDIFIPRESFKETVKKAIDEALGDNDCPPCDTLACADHLTDE